MTITGCGPAIGKPAITYLLLTIIIDLLTKPFFTISENYYTALIIIGIMMIIAGILGVVIAARKLFKSFDAGVLMTDGLYRVCRNPLYAIYVFLVVPGIGLIFNSWLVLSSALVMFILTVVFVREEYKYLEEKFGDEYRKYVERVWIKFI